MGDLLGQAVFDRGARFGDQLQPWVTDFFEMGGDQVGNGVALGLLLKATRNPGARRVVENRCNIRFVRLEGAKIKIGRVVEMMRVAGGVEFNIEHLARNRAPFTAAGDAGILDRVLQIEDYPRGRAGIALIHQHRAAAQQVTVPFQHEIQRRIEQRVAGADKGPGG